MSPKLIGDLSAKLDRGNYPYDITYVRWAGHEDNAEPDPTICDFVRDWNEKYAWPHFIISGTTEAFRAFEQRYGKVIPRWQGDWTPYWEDGAGSTARETAMNRNSSDRLVQAEALWGMFDSKDYPVTDFSDAWRNILLYSEHTWGADCSISQAESAKTKEQWQVKKAFAEDADRQSRELLMKSMAAKSGFPPSWNVVATLRSLYVADEAGSTNRETAPDAGGLHTNWIDVVNTLSWRRSGLATISPERSLAGDRVTDEQEHSVVSQRLRSGELAILVNGVPPFAVKRYRISAGAPFVSKQPISVHNLVLNNGKIQVRIDSTTGAIVELTADGVGGNLVDNAGGQGLNDFLYLPGDDLKNLHGNGPVKISVGEKGPLVASLIIESDAPGCHKLSREVRLVAGQDYVEIHNLVDKAKLQAKDYWAAKESVNFAFPFHVPNGKILMDIPLGGTVQPEVDQLPGSCKNWFTVGRWVDVANQSGGVTWVTLDAPLIEVGGITARLLNSQTDPEVWRQKVDPTQTFYSWVMNNHWSSNYRAFQEGPVTFRYVLRPHHKTDPAENTRFAMGFSQPLLAGPALSGKTRSTPRLTLSSEDVVVFGFKPSDDGKGWIVRLYGASGKERAVKLHWVGAVPKAVYLSNTSETVGDKIGGEVSVPGYGLVTLRIESEE
jgi:alpha-mannosidase